MTRPDAERVPVRPGKQWRCPTCHTTLGTITPGGNLHVTADNVMVELSRLAVVVRCTCGQSKAFSGRRVSIDVPEVRAA